MVIDLGREDDVASPHPGPGLPLAGDAASFGAGTTLTDRDQPIVRFKHLGEGSGPVVGMGFGEARYANGPPLRMIVPLRLEALVPEGADWDGLEQDILDRARDAVLTTTRLVGKGLDARAKEMRRPQVGDLTLSGHRAAAEYEITLTL